LKLSKKIKNKKPKKHKLATLDCIGIKPNSTIGKISFLKKIADYDGHWIIFILILLYGII